MAIQNLILWWSLLWSHILFGKNKIRILIFPKVPWNSNFPNFLVCVDFQSFKIGFNYPICLIFVDLYEHVVWAKFLFHLVLHIGISFDNQIQDVWIRAVPRQCFYDSSCKPVTILPYMTLNSSTNLPSLCYYHPYFYKMHVRILTPYTHNKL